MSALIPNLKKKPVAKKAAPPRPAPKTYTHAVPGSSIPLPSSIDTVLRQVARRHLTLRLFEFPVLFFTVLPLLLLLQMAADRLFNLPWATRALFLGADIGITAVLAYFFAILPWKQRLNTRTAALLVEQKMPRFRTGLISAVELAFAPPAYPVGSKVLVHSLIRRMTREIGREKIPDRVVSSITLRKRLKGMAAALGISIGLFFAYYPKSIVLLQRAFLFNVPLPTSTIVSPISGNLVVPAGSDVELSARAQGVIPRNGRINIIYEDGRKETVNLTARPVEADVFSVNLVNVRQNFRYQFQLNDGVGSEQKVGIKVVPALNAAKFTQIYPDYTGLKEIEMSSGNLSLLAGGKLRIEGESTQPLKSATLILDGPDQKLPMQITGTDRRSIRAEIPVPDENLKALGIQLESAIGEKSVDDPVYRVEITLDRPPIAALTLPKGDKITALAADAPAIAYSIRDDYGVKEVALVYEVFRAGSDGRPDLAEKGRLPLSPANPQTAIRNSIAWDLDKLIPPLVAGSSVSYWIEAKDNNVMPGPGLSVSQKKTIEIVSEETKKMEMLEELGKKAEEIERLYKSQRNVNEKTDSTIRSNQETKP